MPFQFCLEVLLRLDIGLDLWGALGPSFAPVLVWVKLGLDLKLRPDLLPVIRSGCFLICTRCLDHSLAVVEVTDFLVAVGKVTSFSWPLIKWQSSKLSSLKSLPPALPSLQALALEVVDVEVAPVLEGVDVKVA